MPESEYNSATGVRTRLLRFHIPSLYTTKTPRRDETIIRTKSECSKLVQKDYMTRHHCQVKSIHRELCKKLKFGHITEIHNILWDFRIQTDALIIARRTDLEIIHKEKKRDWKRELAFAVPADHKSKRKQRQIPGPCRRTKKAVEHEVDGNSPLVMDPKDLIRELEEMGGRAEIIQIIALLRSVRILRRVLPVDSPSCDIYWLSSLLRSLGAVTKNGR